MATKKPKKPIRTLAAKTAARPAKKSSRVSAKAAKKTTPKKKSTPKSSPALPSGARGQAAIKALIDHLTGPSAPSGDPVPLTDAQLSAFEVAANAALSPALFAVLSIDAGELARDSGWFDKKMRFQAKSFAEVVREQAGQFAELYEPLFERFPGKAIVAFDYPGEWFDLVYFGDADPYGGG